MGSAGDPSVLVVEDEFLLLSMTCDHLRAEGFLVVEAAAARDALTLLEQHPDLAVLFTDVNMPGDLNGLDLAIEVRRTRPHLHVIITSGLWARAGEPVPEGAIFVEKPYSVEAVSALMKSLVATA